MSEQQPPSDEQPKQGETKSILDFIKPEVAQQLQEMGFSKNVSEKACLFTQSNIEAAVEFLNINKIQISRNQHKLRYPLTNNPKFK